MPNSLAYVALLAWPMITVALFRALSIERALIWSILGAYLLLPPAANFDFPMVPALDKTSIPNLAALAACVLMLGRRLPLLPASPVGRVLMLFFVVSPVATVLTNPDPILFENGGGLPGLRAYDAVSAVGNQAIFLLPFFLARQFLASEVAQREILMALVLAGLAYAVPMLIEVRLSPQLNVWIYGFFQHSFEQMMRDGGFRPIVFLYHALWVGFFTLTALVAAFALWRSSGPDRRVPYLLAGGFFVLLLVLVKTFGALLYALCLLPLVWLAGIRMQLRIATVLALLAVAYPLLRGADLVPVETMLAQAEMVDPDRARSLGVRFDSEAQLLDHASVKPLYGWGSWGRNRLYDANGKDVSITDGRWVIVIGVYGWCGYIVEFGLLALPILLLARQARRRPAPAISPYAGPLALLLAINMIDLLPNATLTPLTWLLAGALVGYAEALKEGRPAGVERLRPGPAGDRGGDPGGFPPPEPPRTIL